MDLREIRGSKVQLESLRYQNSKVFYLLIEIGDRRLVTVTADLKSLPTSAVSARVNQLGVPYYAISFSLRIRFLTTLEYTLLYENQVYGSVVAEYE